MKRPLAFRIVAPLLAAVFALAGCSTAPLAPGGPGGTTASATDASTSNTSLLTTTTSLITSVTINGLVGGVVTAGDWTVRVPAGAFSGTGVITITVPDPTVRKCDLNIYPSLLNSFKVPVTLSCRLPTTSDLQSDVMMWWNPNTKEWAVIPSTANLTSMTRDAPLSHFSTYGCGKAGW